MAFFDDLSKKLSSAGQEAVQSTKNFANITKINGLISDEEKKIENLFLQIGKTYFETHGFQPDESVAVLVNAVRASLSNIETYNEQIREIKGVTTCPHCGAEVPFSSAFCNLCGTKMPERIVKQAVPENATPCAVCGAYVPNDYKFCTSCGNVMPVVEVQSPAVGFANEQPASKVCQFCGKTLNADAAFCTGCGLQV